MIKEQTEKRIVEQEIVFSVTCTCDVCKKKIYEKRYNDQYILNGKHESTQYYKVTKGISRASFSRLYRLYRWRSGYNDWGNDSVDSIENYTICSPECLDYFMQEYYYRSFEQKDNNTEWIEIQHDYASNFIGG